MISPTNLSSSLLVTTTQQPEPTLTNSAAPKPSEVVEPSASEKSANQSRSGHPWPQDLEELAKSNPSLASALEELNKNMEAWATGMRFDIDPDTDRIVLSLVDNENGEVIRQVPSDAVMAIAKMIAEFQGKGIRTQA